MPVAVLISISSQAQIFLIVFKVGQVTSLYSGQRRMPDTYFFRGAPNPLIASFLLNEPTQVLQCCHT